jgi:glucose/mannose-6-phosphate isomerase
MLNTLKPILPIGKNDVLESISHLKNQHAKISSENLSDTNPAISLAEWIVGIPAIYYPWGLEAAAIRFKNSFQENAKSHVMAEDVIEACHNGIVAWEKKTNVQPILIRGQDDFVKTAELWKILKSFFEKNQIEYKEVVSVDGSIISKIINLIYLLDFTTIYHSILNGTDPSPVSSIDFIKNQL